MISSSLPYQYLEDDKENYGNDNDDVMYDDDVMCHDDVMYDDDDVMCHDDVIYDDVM